MISVCPLETVAFVQGARTGRGAGERPFQRGIHAIRMAKRGSLRLSLLFHKRVVVLAPLLSGKVKRIHDLEPLTELVECQRVAHLFINAMVKP